MHISFSQEYADDVLKYVSSSIGQKGAKRRGEKEEKKKEKKERRKEKRKYFYKEICI